MERKVDREMAEGKFFAIDRAGEKPTKKRKLTEEKKKENADKQKEKRAKAYVAPEEPKYKSDIPNVNANVDIEKLKKKVKKRKNT